RQSKMARRTMLDMLDIWFGSIASMAFPEDISQYIPQSGGRDHVPGVGCKLRRIGELAVGCGCC
ncbi:MAG: hypothetical protein ACYDBH_22175, partial [Acidobacteriaceae bacterium]